MHAHLHVIPRGVNDQFHWNWRQIAYADDAAKAAVAEEIQKHLHLD